MDPQPHRSGWHLSREVHVSHLIATATVAVSCLWYVAKLEQRIALVEQQIAHQTARDERQDKEMSTNFAMVQSRLDRIDEKLDRIIERSSRQGMR